ncbi:MAG: pyridoxamine 5'-phosphate oxidase family protein [Acidimicrobiia bacterium]|nr:pyridoxamine 5'-phosphate oxidase family protein [Acidimicrobiia bacterium]
MNQHDITSLNQLRSLYRKPSKRAAQKVTSSIGPETARFISLCPFAVLSTASAKGEVDASPRGGPPGFVQVLDDTHIALPDLGGNNRLDSFENIIENGCAGLLLMIPGKEETVRINGDAHLSTDPNLLGSFIKELRTPKLALVIRTDEVFGHCAKALRRSGLWEPTSWTALQDAPDLADIYTCQFKDTDADEMRRDLHEVYRRDLQAD